jgi:ATP-binding protein involved in chromosome partitioning
MSDSTTNAATLDADSVRAALAEVRYPGLTRDLVSFGMVQHVSVCGERVKVRLALRTGDPTVPERLQRAIADRLGAMGAAEVAVELVEPQAAPVPRARTAADPWADQVRLASVRHVVAVGAGKGGVGKSTVAVNLALALAADGLRVGVLDADIYGPSLPILLGVEGGAAEVHMTPEKQIVPLEAHGLPFISFGFFLGAGSPAIWRGPMVSKAVRQFARGVRWPELDVLVVDLPPGTGDVPLSLAQAIELSGAVVVTQPQRLAATEAEKAAQMFAELQVPVLGVVENMTGPFGRGGGRAVADRLGVPYLGDVAFDERMVSEGDTGAPVVVARPESEGARSYTRISRQVAGALGWRHVEADTKSDGDALRDAAAGAST